MTNEKQENELGTGINAEESIDMTVEQGEKNWFLKLQKL